MAAADFCAGTTFFAHALSGFTSGSGEIRLAVWLGVNCCGHALAVCEPACLWWVAIAARNRRRTAAGRRSRTALRHRALPCCTSGAHISITSNHGSADTAGLLDAGGLDPRLDFYWFSLAGNWLCTYAKSALRFCCACRCVRSGMAGGTYGRGTRAAHSIARPTSHRTFAAGVSARRRHVVASDTLDRAQG